MRFSKVIILLLLIVKASLGIGMMPPDTMETCCGHTGDGVEIGIDNEDCGDTEEKKNCCDGPDCHCFCCNAVFIGDNLKEFQLFNSPLRVDPIFDNNDNYHFLILNAIWQPPRVS